MSKSSTRRKIKAKQAQLKVCNRVLDRVQKEIRVLGNEIEDWDRHQNTLLRDEMTSEVLIRNQYEGTNAQETRDRFLDSTVWKNGKNMGSHEVVGDARILRYAIEERIQELREEIDDLYDDLRDS